MYSFKLYVQSQEIFLSKMGLIKQTSKKSQTTQTKQCSSINPKSGITPESPGHCTEVVHCNTGLCFLEETIEALGS